MANIEQYAHVLLFGCPQCDRPLVATCISEKKSLEMAEAKRFNPKCHCGWTGDMAGVTALKHWVEPWHAQVTLREGEAGACD